MIIVSFPTQYSAAKYIGGMKIVQKYLIFFEMNDYKKVGGKS
jgi:hypothetical protein